MVKRSFRFLLLLGLVGVIAGPAQAQFADGLVAYWQLEGNFEDSINGYHGESSETADGTDPIAFTPGKFGEAIRLDGEAQRIYINGGEGGNDNTIVSPNPADDGETIENIFDFAFVEGEPETGSMTLSAWFTVDAFDTSWQCMICKGEGNGWRLHRRGEDNPNELAFTGGNGDTTKNNVEVTQNDGDNLEWHHVVALVDGSLIHDGIEGPQAGVGEDEVEAMMENATRLYLDGQLIASKNNARLENRANLMQIGNNPDSGGREWEGHIDDVAIWNRPLSNDEIASVYNEGAGNSIGFLLNPGLIGDFNGDEVVDLADFAILVENFNGPGDNTQGDINFNGKVDLNDFLGFRIAFNAAGAAVGAAAVPEPAGFALFGTMIVGLMLVRRRRRR